MTEAAAAELLELLDMRFKSGILGLGLAGYDLSGTALRRGAERGEGCAAVLVDDVFPDSELSGEPELAAQVIGLALHAVAGEPVLGLPFDDVVARIQVPGATKITVHPRAPLSARDFSPCFACGFRPSRRGL